MGPPCDTICPVALGEGEPMTDRKRVDMTATELYATIAAVAVMGVLSGWGLFGPPGLIQVSMRGGSIAEWAGAIATTFAAVVALGLGLVSITTSRRSERTSSIALAICVLPTARAVAEWVDQINGEWGEDYLEMHPALLHSDEQTRISLFNLGKRAPGGELASTIAVWGAADDKLVRVIAELASLVAQVSVEAKRPMNSAVEDVFKGAEEFFARFTSLLDETGAKAGEVEMLCEMHARK